jgi:hypothetical protein
MFLRHSSNDARRGIILIVVLALLTLFAIVGLSFVLYAQAEAESSRLYKEDKNLRKPLESADRMMAFAWSKLLYDDFDDATGVYSSIRGHSLARSMYGFDNALAYDRSTTNPPVYVPNQTPFNGTGRNVFATVTTPFGVPETQLINYTYFPGDPVAAGQAHDPERLGWGAPILAGGANPRPITGGANVPYTYPDLNNMFLGAINAGGQVLMPSFHRPWLFGGNTPAANPNWEQKNVGKYLTLRPRPVDQVTPLQVATWNALNPTQAVPPLPWNLDTLTAPAPANISALINYFQQQNTGGLLPYPEDASGDVKNLYWLPGGNDSYWVDLGYPVQVAPDGRKYKPLFAFFITDLDNRINLNVHGNIRGAGGAHVSNQGWVKTEVNLSNVMLPNVQTATPNAAAPAAEWQQVFTGVPNPGPGSFNQVTIRGKYGWNLAPDDPLTYGAGGNFSPSGTTPHSYGQVDFDACQLNFAATLPILLPGQVPATWGPYNCFPGFLTGYDNGSGGPNNNAERVNHPLIYDFFCPFSVPAGSALANPTPVAPDNRPASDDKGFPAFEMKDLLNGGLVADASAGGPYGTAPIMAANAMKSQLGVLLPYNFNDPLDIAGSLRRRSLVTTLSMEVNQPGMSPWMWNADQTNATTGAFLYANQVQGPRAGDDPIASRAPWGNPSPFPDPMTNRTAGIPFNSEFGVPSPQTGLQVYQQSAWRAVTNGVNPPFNTNILGLGAPLPASALTAIKPFLGKLDLSRPLQPYPNQILPTIIRFDDDTPMAGDPQGRTIRQVYLAAQLDRQTLAWDIYRLLKKLTGIPSVATPATPTEADLMPRRWLAQLAVNIVDFIDSDDISTPLNFYPDPLYDTPATDAGIGSNPPPPPPPAPGVPSNPPVLIPATATQPAVYETLKYWVFGVEMPRVLLNEVFVEYNDPPTATSTPPYPLNINVWAELFAPMPNTVSATVDQTDAAPVLLAVPQGAAPAQTPYAPYRIVIADTAAAATGGPLLPRPLAAGFGNDNIIGTPDTLRRQTDDPTDPTTTAFLGTYYTATLGQGTLTAGAAAAMNPQTFLVVGPGANAKPAGPAPLGFSDQHLSATYTTLPTIPSQLPNGTVCVPSQAMSYQVQVTKNALTGAITWAPDDRTNGLSLLVRRLSNPRMPPNNNPADPQFNPYVTIDYLHGIPFSNNNYKNGNGQYYWSYGKLQPYAADPNLDVPQGQTAAPPAAPPPPKTGETAHTLGQQNVWGQANAVVAPFLAANQPNPAYPAYDWLVHLDRALVSPIELLNVCFYHPHELTHRFVVPSTGAPITAAPFPAQWKYKHTGLGPWYDEILKLTRNGAWFDQTSRLYRFLEFVEVFDRAYGMPADGAFGQGTATVTVNGVQYNFPYNYGISSIGRRPGRVNINTVWDLEILNALLDPQTSNYFTASDIQNFIYPNLLNGRSPNYQTAITNGTPLQALSQLDRPFTSMASGNIPYTDPFYPNGTSTFFPFASGIGDTFLRPNLLALNTLAGDTTNQGHPDLPRLFENPNSLTQVAAGPPPVYTSNANAPQLSNPYLRFEPLNKVYNNLTTRSNVFAVWCTMGYFEVIDDSTRPVKLGAEIGKAAGTNVRHRFFGVIDRTEMVIAPKLINSANGPGGAVVNTNNPLVGPGQAWVEVDLLSGPAQFATYNNGVVSESIPNPSGQPPMYWTMSAGTVLVVDRGTRNEEWVQVTNMWPPNSNPPPPGTPPPGMPPASPTNNSPFWIQANFIRPHNPGFIITQPGNPGPQPPIDVRNYFHTPVVPVSVNLQN